MSANKVWLDISNLLPTKKSQAQSVRFFSGRRPLARLRVEKADNLKKETTKYNNYLFAYFDIYE